MIDNFECKKCKETFHILQYSFKYENGVEVFSTKEGQIICPKCGSKDITFIKRGEINLYSILYSSYSAMSPEQKREVLRKRADDHKKKTEEQYKILDREFRGVCNPKHY